MHGQAFGCSEGSAAGSANGQYNIAAEGELSLIVHVTTSSHIRVRQRRSVAWWRYRARVELLAKSCNINLKKLFNMCCEASSYISAHLVQKSLPIVAASKR